MPVLKRSFICLFAIAFIFCSTKSYAACSSPAGSAGDQVYNSTYDIMQYCNGSQWMAMSVVDSIWTKVNSDIYFTGGKVGIGTQTPSTALEVAGIITAGDVIRLADETGTSCAEAGEIRYNSTYQTTEVCNGTAWQRAVKGNLSTQGAVPFVGVDGILEEDPTNLFWDDANDALTVGNKINFKSITGALPDGEVSGADMVLGDISDVNVSGASNGDSLVYNGSGWVVQDVLGSAGINDLTDVAITGATENDTLTYNGSNWVNQGQTWSKSGNNVYYNGGNVGIGTAAPTSSLSVSGNVAVSGNVSVSGTVQGNNPSGTGVLGTSSVVGNSGVRGDNENGYGVSGSSTSSYGVYGISTTNYGLYGTSTSGNGIAGVSGSGNGGYFSSTSGNAFVTGTGNVGIGTETTVNKLDVEGGVAIGENYSGTAGAPVNGALIEGNVGIGTETSVNKLDVEGGVAIGTTYSGTTAAPANGAIIEGNVGIGVANPTAKLEVNGTIRGNNAFVANNIVQSSSFLTSSTAYVDVSGSSKTVTVPDGMAMIFWSMSGYTSGTNTGLTMRVCIDTTCGGDVNTFTNEASSHKMFSGSWITPVTAGTKNVRLQMLIRYGSGSFVMDSSDSLSWALIVFRGDGS